jgi:ubiquinone/menaquinone biosynthesis C-methylase UbiE
MNKPSLEFAAERNVWEKLGEQDPLWAVLSENGKEGGRWSIDEFLETGEADVVRYHVLMQRHLSCPPQIGHMLDFGCGVGRLSLAWSRRCDRVTGVDVSSSMVDRASEILASTPNAEALLNSTGDLKQFRDGMFDAVTSHICLQHIPPTFLSFYIEEFGRICRPEGIVAFQMPTSEVSTGILPKIRRRLVESLPFGLANRYRKWKSGSEVRFRVFCLPTETIIESASRGGLSLEHMEPDLSAGSGYASSIFLFRRSR